MSILEQIMDRYPDQTFLKADGFDDAVIGVHAAMEEPRLVYSVTKCLEILSEDMSATEAREHFDFNVAGAYMGEQTPIWCEDDFE